MENPSFYLLVAAYFCLPAGSHEDTSMSGYSFDRWWYDGLTLLQLKNKFKARYDISVGRQRLYVFNQTWNSNIPVADNGLQTLENDAIMISNHITDNSWIILDILPEENPQAKAEAALSQNMKLINYPQ